MYSGGMSIKALARLGGALYVTCIVSGFCAEFFARERIIVPGDAAATASHIVASAWLYRLGFFADLTAMTTGTLLCVIYYRLFKPVSRNVALVGLLLGVVSNGVSLAAAANLYAPLVILVDNDYLRGFDAAQRAGLAFLSIRMYVLAYAVNLGLFGLECLASGYLIFKSTFMPRALGIMLGLGGLCYLTNSLVDFMPKGTGDWLFPWVLLPSLVAESSIALWLLVAGVDAAKWEALAARSPRVPEPIAGLRGA
jgi:hypothetical protein